MTTSKASPGTSAKKPGMRASFSELKAFAGADALISYQPMCGTRFNLMRTTQTTATITASQSMLKGKRRSLILLVILH
jgi:hypothetical protein